MGEQTDWHMVLVTTPAELARARESAAQTVRAKASRKARADLLRGDAAARTGFRRRWAATQKAVRPEDLLPLHPVLTGHGPPPPEATGDWYLDLDSGTLYEPEED